MADDNPMVELLNRRKALKTKLTRVERASLAFNEETTRAYLEVQLELVEKIEVDILTFEDDMLAAVPVDQYDAQAAECGQLIERCLVVKATLKGLIQPTLRATFRDAGVETAEGNNSHIGVKLPKLPKLPQFSGNLHEWISFRDRFVAAIHSKPDHVLKGSEKLEYLKASLSGEAADVIQSIQVTDDNYFIAWDMLQRQYENLREISRAHLDRFFGQESVKPGCGTSLRSLVNRTNECMRSLANLGAPVEHWDIILCFVLNKKLDHETRQQWELTFHNGSFPHLEDMLDFLDRRARSFAAAGPSAASMQQEGPPVKKGKYMQDTASFHVSTSKQCGICKGDHPAFKCKKLLDSRPAERQDLVQKSGLCFNCLAAGHSSRQCNAGGCTRCGKHHNTLLHVDENATTQKTPVTSNHGCEIALGRTVLLSTALVKIDDKFGQSNTIRTLIDDGSQASFIKESCVQRLCLQREAANARITGVGNKIVALARGKVTLIVKSHFDLQFSLTAEVLILPDVSGYQPFVSGKSEWEHLCGFHLADPKFYARGEIELLLGADVKADITRAGLLQGPAGTPVAQLTAFGWTISGSVQSVDSPTIMVHHAHLDLESLVHRFWEVEDVPNNRPLTFEDKMAEEQYASTTERDETGKFVVRLPFRTDKPPLGRSRDVAVRRLLQTERKLGWGTDRREKYAAVINEYLELDHMEQVPENELVMPDDQVYYLPHHAVIKESSTTTKLRVVFDASAKTSSGVSLNEKLMTGPTIQQDIFSILVRSRKHQIMFCADICKMYRQIWVHPKDRDFQRILWRSSAKEPIQEFRLKTVTFGYASSPFQAIRSMFQLATDEETDFPLAAKIIRRDSYVDDVISGTDSLEEAIRIQDELMRMLERGGFPLRKWSSNSTELLARLEPELRETQLPLKIDSDDTIKTLGIHWNPACDTFGFKVDSMAGSTSVCKRAVLSAMSRVFDPLGWLSPVTVRAKILFQSTWKLGQDWDDELPLPELRLWQSYQADLQELRAVTLPRCIVIPGAISYELHAFSDASEFAYAAVVYLRSIDSTGASCTRVVAAKTKVAPMKTVSVPRLELCGALLLSRLVDNVISALELQLTSIRAYTDSTIVLHWVTEFSHRWKKFVANRVTQIQEVLPSSLWRHVGTKHNPADCASRGVKVDELINHDLWWNGPTWVQDGTYPINANIPDFTGQIPEEKTEKIRAHIATENTFLNRFSSYSRMIRITALCLRYLNNIRPGSQSKTVGWLSSSELKEAELKLVKVVQTDAYSSELRVLRSKNQDEVENEIKFSKKSRIAGLSPVLDENGIMRVGGRLKHARIAFEMKHPIILPRYHRFTDLLLEYEHVRGLHAGPQLMLATLLQRFWVIGGRDAARRIVAKCVRCHRFTAPPVGQLMADLPETRVNPTRPFLNCGIDYAGPLMLKVMKSRQGKKQVANKYKGYVALFICFNTRAIHLELVSDLTSGACMAALERFVALRGLPESITSDRATNFRGVANQLRDFVRVVNSTAHQNTMANYCAERHIKWNFNLVATPHHGGLWEAGIKSFKYHMRRVVGNTMMTYEEAITVLTKISACLNSRPLTELSADPNDLAVLTPGHFITGDSLLAVPQPDFTVKSITLLTRWQLLQRVTQHFWRRWSKEYLTRLQQRPKWWTTPGNVTKGALVLVRDENLPPLKWKLGRITATHPGKDGRVRAVTLKTEKGIMDYTIVKISLLPFNRNDK